VNGTSIDVLVMRGDLKKLKPLYSLTDGNSLLDLLFSDTFFIILRQLVRVFFKKWWGQNMWRS